MEDSSVDDTAAGDTPSSGESGSKESDNSTSDGNGSSSAWDEFAQRAFTTNTKALVHRSFVPRTRKPYIEPVTDIVDPEAAQLFQDAQRLGIEGHYSEAIKKLLRAYFICGEVDDANGEALATMRTAYMGSKLNDTTKAFELFLYAAESYEALGDSQMHVCSLINAAINARKLGEYESALEMLEESQQLAEQTGDRSNLAHALAGIGNVQQAQRKWSEAIPYHLSAAQHFKAVDLTERQAVNMELASCAASEACQYDDALKFSKQAHDLHASFGNLKGQASALATGSVVFNKLENWPEAFHWRLKAAELWKKSGNTEEQAFHTRIAGNFATRMEEYTTALDLYMQAHQLHTQMGDVEGKALSSEKIAFTQAVLKNWPQALHWYILAATLAEQIGNVELQIIALKNGVYSAEQTGDYDTAADMREKADRLSS